MSSSRDHRRQLYEQLVGQPVGQGRFLINKLLGFGGMGAVYEATQLNMDRKVAIKLISIHDPTTVARFEREALTISKLRHPNTVTVFDFGTSDGGFLFLSMELLDGRTLSDVIRDDGPISPERAVYITSQICRSLNEAHHAGIVHRDIKPDNIILISVDADDDVVKVLDFGIAKAVIGDDDVQLTGDGRIIGTPRYMSPEQILAESLDHRSDIYSLGCILFEMLCGAPPFQQSSTTALMISHTQDPPPAFAQRLPSDAMSDMPGNLEHVVRKALMKDPNSRHQTTDEFRFALEEALKSAPRPYVDPGATAASIPSSLLDKPEAFISPPPEVVQRAERAKKKTPAILLIGIGALVIALLAMGAMTMMKQGEPEVEKPPVVVPVEKPVVAEKPVVKPAKSGFVEVKIETTPNGAEVFRNGEGTGQKTPTTLVLKGGVRADLAFELDGYTRYEAEIVPSAGRVVSYELEKTKSAKKTKTKTKRKRKVEEVVEVKPVETPKPVKEEFSIDRLEDDAPPIPKIDD